MATPDDVARRIKQMSHKIATKVHDTPTGIPPGFDPATGITWLENGKARGRRTGGQRLLLRARMNYDVDISGSSPVHVDFATTYYDPSGLVSAGPPYNVAIPSDGWYSLVGSVMLDVAFDATDVAALFRTPSLRAVVDNIDSDGWCMWQTPIIPIGGAELQFCMQGTWTGYFTAGQLVGLAVFNDFSGTVSIIDGDVATATRFEVIQWT